MSNEPTVDTGAFVEEKDEGVDEEDETEMEEE